MKNDPSKDGEALLRQLADESIVHDHLGRKIILTDVIDHLSMKPYEPLPSDLIDVLDRWLRATSGCRIENAKVGRNEAPWYPVAERLIANGFSRLKACEEIIKDPEYQDLNIDSMMTMLKRRTGKRSEARKWLDQQVNALFNTRKRSRD